MPIIMMFCSALVELTGLWDSQVMANHAAWQVGRIAMVRGSDGMHFANTVSDWKKKSETGVMPGQMPDAVKQLLLPLFKDSMATLDKFNDRAVITTTLLMMTCQMGYFGKPPGTAIGDFLVRFFVDPVKNLGTVLPGLIKELVQVKFDDLIKKDVSGVLKLIVDALNKVLDSVFETVFTPLVSSLTDELTKLLAKMMEGISAGVMGDGAALLLAREAYGAAQRVASESDVSNIVKVERLADVNDRYRFSRYRPLDFPEVIDKKAKTEDERVKETSGWPPNNQEMSMLHVRVSWPYSRGWMFPVLSGGTAKADGVRAIGHAMVLPQPSILNENLASAGAVAYAEGGYTNVIVETFSDLMKDMDLYMRQLLYVTQYRICTEVLTVFRLHSHLTTNPSWAVKPWWGPGDTEGHNPVRDPEGIFPESHYEYHKWSGDTVKPSPLFRANWKELTGHDGLNCYSDWGDVDKQDCFKPGTYHVKAYLHWPDTKTTGYRYSFTSYDLAATMVEDYRGTKHNLSRGLDLLRYGVPPWDHGKVWPNYVPLQARFGVNAENAMWLGKGKSESQRYAQEAEAVRAQSNQQQNYYNKIAKLVRDEIAEMDRLIHGGEPIGDDIIPTDAKEVIEDPQKAQEKARNKWLKMTNEVDAAWRDLNKEVQALTAQDGKYAAACAAMAVDHATSVDSFILVLLAACQDPMGQGVGTIDALRIWADAKHLTLPKDLLPSVRTVKTRLDELDPILRRCWQKEVELGKKIGLKAAQDADPGLKPEDLPTDPVRDPETDVPEGSLGDGNDDDRLGDEWTRRNGVWK